MKSLEFPIQHFLVVFPSEAGRRGGAEGTGAELNRSENISKMRKYNIWSKKLSKFMNLQKYIWYFFMRSQYRNFNRGNVVFIKIN